MLQNISILSSMTQHKFGVFSRTQIQEKKKRRGGMKQNIHFTVLFYSSCKYFKRAAGSYRETEDTNTLSHSCLLKFIFDE